LILLSSFPSVAFGLSKDASGWSVVSPSADSNVVYVDPTLGNNGTCAAYTTSDEEMGADPFNPAGAVVPCADYPTAYAFTSNGRGDWILIKRGEVLNEAIGNQIRSGESEDDRFVIGSYGSGALPIIQPGEDIAIFPTSGKSNVAIIGIDFYAHTRDPENGSYSEGSGDEGVRIILGAGQTVSNFLIEGCKFRFFYNNLDIQSSGGAADITVTIRRNTIMNAYHNSANSQGIYASNLKGLIEENILDHNGWYNQAGGGNPGAATALNHNMYLSNCRNLTIQNNIILRASSIGIKLAANNTQAAASNIIIQNNLIIDCELGISAGGNTTESLRFQAMTIYNNVLLNLGRSQPTGRNLGWGIGIEDWDGGSVYQNIIAYNDNAAVTSTRGIDHNGTSQNVNIYDNIVYDIEGRGFTIGSRGTTTGVVFGSNNKIQLPDSAKNSGRIVYVDDTDENGITFTGNTYYNDEASGQEFYRNSGALSTADWATATGDDSTFAQYNFPDPRTIEDYQDSLGATATIDAFITACRAQSYINWDTDYEADAVNNYIRSGFSLVREAIKGIIIH